MKLSLSKRKIVTLLFTSVIPFAQASTLELKVAPREEGAWVTVKSDGQPRPKILVTTNIDSAEHYTDRHGRVYIHVNRIGPGSVRFTADDNN